MSKVVDKSGIVNKWVAKKRAEAEALPWPLVVMTTNMTPADHRENTEEYAEAVFRSLMEQVCFSALKKLREAGRTGEVQRLKLVCYNTETDS